MPGKVMRKGDLMLFLFVRRGAPHRDARHWKSVTFCPIGTTSIRRWWKRDPLFEHDDLLVPLCINHFDAAKPAFFSIYVYGLRSSHHVIDALRGDLEYVVLLVVGQASQRQLLALNLIAQLTADDPDLDRFTSKGFRHRVKVRMPLCTFKLLYRHFSVSYCLA